MVKLKGPALSQEASGQLAKTLTFAQLKKSPYLKTISIPKQPRTPEQMIPRIIVGFLGKNWRNLSQAQKATWSPRANALHLSPYHAFVRVNAKRFSTWRAPSKQDPATEAGVPGPINSLTAVGGKGYVKLQVTRWGPPLMWGFILQRSTAWPMPPKFLEQVAVFVMNPIGLVTTYYDTGLAPGVYYHGVRHFYPTGLLHTNFPVTTTTVT